jgi:uncharacterized protein (TIGR03089 family)
VQLSPPSRPDPDVADLAAALRDAHAAVGAGPAVTVLFPEGRQEQGVASLAQWAAKGAHLLEAELLMSPGDALRLEAPLSWTSAAVSLAAWWAGLAITLDEDTEVAVVHAERRADVAAGDVLVLGDRIDGAPDDGTADEPWVRAVQSFPDQPPMPRARADGPALRSDGRRWSHRDLLEAARGIAPGSGTLGVDAATVEPVEGLIAVAVRPLVTHRPTVVLRGVDRSAADGDRIAAWLGG